MKSLLVTLGLALAAAIGLGAGYLLWDTPKNWYAANVNKLGPGAENDLIRYGRDLIVDTARHIGVNAEILPCAMRATISPARAAT